MKTSGLFTSQDLAQMKTHGIPAEEVTKQAERFQKGFVKPRLDRVCRAGDGIVRLSDSELDRYSREFDRVLKEGRVMKFVPASGAATRMFRSLEAVVKRPGAISGDQLKKEGTDKDVNALERFLKQIKKFAFYGDLEQVLKSKGHDLGGLLKQGDYKTILRYLLTPDGLNLTNLPKGMILFHTYPEGPRTAFEEQLVEAAVYAKDGSGHIRVHFTVPHDFRSEVKRHTETAAQRFAANGVTFEIDLSIQEASTDTVAADQHNKLFRDRDGRLVFRPGGHGALIHNLAALKGDIVFIKNIDNVAHDRLKETTYQHKKTLGGYLAAVQEEIARYLNRLDKGDVEDIELSRIAAFLEKKLGTQCPPVYGKLKREEKKRYLRTKLNRPVRVCGAVKNEGEPGGGPFWVQTPEGNSCLQIIESAQVDMDDAGQKKIWESATHFNPVDLVCGLRDYQGRPFDLLNFVDAEAGMISKKSKDGRELRALELPGLWNGAMADWNTVFVEVPIETFNPVKTVLDLLRPAHQPAG